MIPSGMLTRGRWRGGRAFRGWGRRPGTGADGEKGDASGGEDAVAGEFGFGGEEGEGSDDHGDGGETHGQQIQGEGGEKDEDHATVPGMTAPGWLNSA